VGIRLPKSTNAPSANAASGAIRIPQPCVVLLFRLNAVYISAGNKPIERFRQLFKATF
jgi:hypothetical protein